MSGPFDPPSREPDPADVYRSLGRWQLAFGAVACLAGVTRLLERTEWFADRAPHLAGLPALLETVLTSTTSVAPSVALVVVGGAAVITAFTDPASEVDRLRRQRRLWLIAAMATVGSLGMYLLAATLVVAADALL